ncbi:MAG: hypothetical protein M1150_02210 [Patescibacteria group bacterium]|nr:hypothetical protein [Patescibacteria group bacterium]
MDNLNKQDLAELVKELSLNTDYRVDFTIILNEKLIKPDLPKGTYLGIKYYDHLPPEEQSSKSGRLWKIDIWFLSVQGSAKTREIRDKLTEEKRDIILEIKNVLAHNPQYRKTIKSSDIYIAVLDRDVKDMAGFEEYLRETGRSLE